MIGTSPECSHHLLFISTDSQYLLANITVLLKGFIFNEIEPSVIDKWVIISKLVYTGSRLQRVKRCKKPCSLYVGARCNQTFTHCIQ